jgi:hypothetical protein
MRTGYCVDGEAVFLGAVSHGGFSLGRGTVRSPYLMTLSAEICLERNVAIHWRHKARCGLLELPIITFFSIASRKRLRFLSVISGPKEMFLCLLNE